LRCAHGCLRNSAEGWARRQRLAEKGEDMLGEFIFAL
jgi:hypothetical protein